MPMREITVAQAAPRTPIAGAPSLPKMSSQFTNTLSTLAVTSAIITGRTIAHALEVAPERRVEQQRQDAPRHDAQVGRRQAQHLGIEPPAVERGAERQEHEGDRQGQEQGERDAVQQPAMAVLQPSGAEGLRHERVETEQQAHGEDADAHEQRRSHAHRPDRLGTDPADHQGIDQPHRHPSELGEDDREREGEHRPELTAQIGSTTDFTG